MSESSTPSPGRTAAESRESEPCFTLVFAGDIGQTQGNPFGIDTPFGRAVVAGRGDAIGEAAILRDLLDEAVALLEVGDEANTPGTDTYTFIASTRWVIDRLDADALASARALPSTAPGTEG